jgi:carbon-monoxide dehydrogenase large subunit
LSAITEPHTSYVGSSERKHNGDRFLTGRVEYINDVVLPGTVHMAVLRSPHAHARIVRVDTTKAKNAPGVVAALSGEDARSLCNPIPHFIDPAAFGGKTAEVRVLAVDKVIYQGQPVAAVVAATAGDAQAALDLIEVEYEPLQAVVHGGAASAEGATLIHEEWGDNVVITVPFVEGDVDAALEQADHVIEETLQIQRYSSQSIEPRGYVASWDESSEMLTFHGAVQNPHPLRFVLAKALNLDEGQVRVIASSLGGAFGLKMHGHPEEPLTCVFSRLTGRPVKWIEDRRETLLVGGREHSHCITVGFTNDGKVTALRDHFIANIGALGATPGWGMAFLTALSFPTGYKIPNTDCVVTAVTTNKAPWNATRGYGKEGTNLVMERVMDMVAARTGIDPAEVRRRNFIGKDEFPYKTNSGLNVDSGDYHALLDKVLDLVDYDSLREQQAKAREEGRHIGIGIAFELTPEAADIPGSLVTGFDTSTVRMDPSGKVLLLTGVTTPGSGNDTSMMQIVADELGVLLSDVTVIQGDTTVCPYGFGHFSGRSMVVGGNAALLAAGDIKQKLVKVAAAMLEADEADIRLGQRMATLASDPEKSIPIADVAYAVYSLTFIFAKGVEPPLESTRVYMPDNIDHTPDEKGRIQPYPTYSNAIHAAVVEVDVETGKVTLERLAVGHDCGTVINPLYVEGQMEGAIAMGVGAGLTEEQRYDDEGNFISNSFKRYLLPRAKDMPSIEMVHQVTPSPFTLLGVKGAGEAGIGGAQSAIANAVHDALAPLGVTVRKMPLTPATVLDAIEEARR